MSITLEHRSTQMSIALPLLVKMKYNSAKISTRIYFHLSQAGAVISHLAGAITNFVKTIFYTLCFAITLGQSKELNKHLFNSAASIGLDTVCIPLSFFGVFDPVDAIIVKGKLNQLVLNLIN